MVCCAKVLYPGFLPFCTVGTLANPHQACNAFVLYHDTIVYPEDIHAEDKLASPDLHSCRGQTCFEGFKGFWAELRSSLA